MFKRNGVHKKKELHFWVMPNAGFATRTTLQSHIAQFERLNPDVSVHLTVHPWSLAWNRVMDVIKNRHTGPTPDVIQVGTTWVATLVYLGALEKVPHKDIFPDDDSISTCIWDPGDPNDAEGELHCVPWFIDVRVLYARRDVLQSLGLSLAMLQDWKGFLEVCSVIQQHLHRAGPVSKIVAPLRIPGQKPTVLIHDLAPWIWGAGGDFCSADLRKADLSADTVASGCRFYFDLIEQKLMPIPEDPVSQGNIFSGHYALQISGSWPYENFLKPSSPYYVPEVADNLEVSLLPAGPQGRFTFLGGSNLAVLSDSKNKEPAWKLIRFLSEPNRQLAHARSIGALPAWMDSMERLFDGQANAKRAFWESFGYARRLPRLVELGTVECIIQKMSNRILSSVHERKYNHKVLQDQLERAQEEINTVLSLHRYAASSVRKK